MKLKCNCCDGVYNSFDVHFTSACPFNCSHCIDKKYDGLGIIKPNVDAIVKTVGSAFANGCQTYIDTSKLFPNLKTPILLKRSCFMCEETLNATFADGVKAFCNLFTSPKNKYGVIYEDGSLKGGWV